MKIDVYKKDALFVLKATVLYALAYLLVGGLAYQFITRQFYVGDDAVFAEFLRSEADQDEWSHVNSWMIPVLLVRGALISVVLLPFVEALKKMAFARRTGVLFALMFVLLHMAAAAPSPSNLEGLVYMKPVFIGVEPFFLTQPEMLFQCMLFALGLAWLVERSPRREADSAASSDSH